MIYLVKAELQFMQIDKKLWRYNAKGRLYDALLLYILLSTRNRVINNSVPIGCSII